MSPRVAGKPLCREDKTNLAGDEDQLVVEERGVAKCDVNQAQAAARLPQKAPTSKDRKPSPPLPNGLEAEGFAAPRGPKTGGPSPRRPEAAGEMALE